jgi:hypothetical protein
MTEWGESRLQVDPFRIPRLRAEGRSNYRKDFFHHEGHEEHEVYEFVVQFLRDLRGEVLIWRSLRLIVLLSFDRIL